MIAKKPAAAFCSGNLNGLRSWTITSSNQPWRSTTAKTSHSARHYASVQHHDKQDKELPGDVKLKHNAELRWPLSPNPTPYEIFNLPKDSPYNKRRFYQLVMLYHPDRHHHTSHDGISHLTKLDRYRLVVSANHILSDPEKRRQYDIHGTGWGTQDLRARYRSADRAWHQEAGNASMNATWEDWDRWYQERDGVKQETVFMSNGLFATVLVFFVFIGLWGEVTRAGKRSAAILAAHDEQRAAISRQLRERQAHMTGLTKDDRVQRFLRQRDGWQPEQASHVPVPVQGEAGPKEPS
ncbi:hypothetical protein V8F06_003447 [Rhypophila decipiens]